MPPSDRAAHARAPRRALAVHDVAGRGAHDRDHLAGLDRLGGGRGDVGVDVADRHRDALGQPGPRGRLGRQRRRRARRAARAACSSLSATKPAKPLVERGEVVLGRVGAVLVDALVAGGARVARLLAAQLPDDPVGAPRSSGPSRRRPRGPPPAPAAPSRTATRRRSCRRSAASHGSPRSCGERGDPVGLRLGGVVLPQLRVGVRPAAELGQLAQRRAVGERRQRRRRGEVGADADDLGGIDAGGRHGGGDGRAQHLAPVVGVLQRPRGRSRSPVAGSASSITALAVVGDRRAELRAVARPAPPRRGRTACRSRPRPRSGRSRALQGWTPSRGDVSAHTCFVKRAAPPPTRGRAARRSPRSATRP